MRNDDSGCSFLVDFSGRSIYRRCVWGLAVAVNRRIHICRLSGNVEERGARAVLTVEIRIGR